jgi:uncharacterized protein (DUF736 family)
MAMATIGTFKKSGETYVGSIITFAVQAPDVRIVPAAEAPLADQPSHRVLANGAELGAAWTRQGQAGRAYLRLKLDDPSFATPLYANLIDDGDDGFKLIWSRDDN